MRQFDNIQHDRIPDEVVRHHTTHTSNLPTPLQAQWANEFGDLEAAAVSGSDSDLLWDWLLESVSDSTELPLAPVNANETLPGEQSSLNRMASLFDFSTWPSSYRVHHAELVHR